MLDLLMAESQWLQSQLDPECIADEAPLNSIVSTNQPLLDLCDDWVV